MHLQMVYLLVVGYDHSGKSSRSPTITNLSNEAGATHSFEVLAVRGPHGESKINLAGGDQEGSRLVS